MRLDKFICESTELSRAQAKRAIGKGEVTLEGVVVKDPSTKVDDSSEVTYGGRPLRVRGPRYIMLNKPLDTVCTSIEDDYRSVLGLLEIEKAETLHVAGRLDIDTTGLVLITDDGAWSHRITSPKKQCGKRYRVMLAEAVSDDVVERFAEGILLKGERHPTQPARLEIVSSKEVLLTLSEGKYHQVKRMFGALENRVTGLHREQIGNICLDDNLESGEWRYLTEQEINLVD